MIKSNSKNALQRKTTGAHLCNFIKLATLISIGCHLILSVEASGDDIILTKGKLIMRGGKNKGNLILDTGSKEHHGGGHMMMPPMMGHHFNPFSFYPMHQHEHHHHQPQMMPMMHPIYVEDHSAMHQSGGHHEAHHQPSHYEHHEHHQQPSYEHHEQHYEHHEHHEPEHHQVEEVHHSEPQHHEMGHHHMMPIMQHEMVGQHHYEQEAGHHQGQDSVPNLSAMMMHGSVPAPSYQQMAAMQAAQLQHQIQMSQAMEAARMNGQGQPMGTDEAAVGSEHHQQKQQVQTAEGQDKKSNTNEKQSNSKRSTLASIIRPLFSRGVLKKDKNNQNSET